MISTVRKVLALLLWSLWIVVGLPPTLSLADESSPWAFRAYTGFMPLASGEAIPERHFNFPDLKFTGDSQNYSDVYAGGIPFMWETIYRLTSSWSLHGGGGVQYFPAKSFNLTTGLLYRYTNGSYEPEPLIEMAQLDDMIRFPLYVGGAYHFPRFPQSPFDFYFRTDVGLVVQTAVDINEQFFLSRTNTYSSHGLWDTSVLALIDGGLGVEFPIKAIKGFAEIRIQYTSAPSLSGIAERRGFKEPYGLLAIPILVGLTF